MKKLIAAVALSLSFCATAIAGPTFDHWTAEGDYIINAGTWENGTTAGIIVNKNTATTVWVNPKAGDLGTVVHEEAGELTADKQPLKAHIVWYSSGAVLISPTTRKGNNFLNEKLWKQKTVSFKFKEFDFWVSAKGVQKAWGFLNSKKQAI